MSVLIMPELCVCPYYVYVRTNVYVRTMCMSVRVYYLCPYYVYARTMCMSVLYVCPYYVYVRTMCMSVNKCPY